ncbi:MAG: aldo/keto reductase, partial [Comamonas sp.]
VRLAQAHGLPRVASIQNPYCLLNRSYDNALDETCDRLDVSLLAYSPLGVGLLTGKYDASGIEGPDAPRGTRLSYESVRKQRWGRPDALVAALQRGRPGMAAIDVFESEPILQGHALLRMENCICTPHLGYVEQDSYELYFGTAFENVVNFIQGMPTQIVNPDYQRVAR